MTDPTSISVWIKRIAKCAIGTILTVLIIGAVAQQALEWRDRRAVTVPGKLVDVNGHAMHIYCVGQGGPAVILDSGLGGNFLDWAPVQDDLGTISLTCSFDRAGAGLSDPSPLPRTAVNMAKELNDLLTNDAIPGPYVLVAHSAAGLTARQFALANPDKVAGIVFVDTSYETQMQRFNEITNGVMAQNRVAQINDLKRTQMKWSFGYGRLFSDCGKVTPDMEQWKPVVKSAECRTESIRTVIREIEGFQNPPPSLAPGALGDRPLLVLTAGASQTAPAMQPYADRIRAAWLDMQKQQAMLSTNSKQVTVEGSFHYIHRTKPKAVVEGVRLVVDAVRNQRRITDAPLTW